MKTLNSNIPESAKILTAALSNQEDLLNLVWNIIGWICNQATLLCLNSHFWNEVLNLESMKLYSFDPHGIKQPGFLSKMTTVL